MRVPAPEVACLVLLLPLVLAAGLLQGETFTESVVVTPLPNHATLVQLQFDSSRPAPSSDADPDGWAAYSAFPRPLAEILGETGASYVALSLTQGVWQTDNWGPRYASSYSFNSTSSDTALPAPLAGLETQPMPPGALLDVSFESPSSFSTSSRPRPLTEKESSSYTLLTGALSGLFCASLSSFSPSETASIPTNRVPHGWVHRAALPREATCSENISAAARLLPCRAAAGAGALLQSPEALLASYLYLSVSVTASREISRVLKGPSEVWRARVSVTLAVPTVTLSAPLALSGAAAASAAAEAGAAGAAAPARISLLEAWLQPTVTSGSTVGVPALPACPAAAGAKDSTFWLHLPPWLLSSLARTAPATTTAATAAVAVATSEAGAAGAGGVGGAPMGSGLPRVHVGGRAVRWHGHGVSPEVHSGHAREALALEPLQGGAYARDLLAKGVSASVDEDGSVTLTPLPSYNPSQGAADLWAEFPLALSPQDASKYHLLDGTYPLSRAPGAMELVGVLPHNPWEVASMNLRLASSLSLPPSAGSDAAADTAAVAGRGRAKRRGRGSGGVSPTSTHLSTFIAGTQESVLALTPAQAPLTAAASAAIAAAAAAATAADAVPRPPASVLWAGSPVAVTASVFGASLRAGVLRLDFDSSPFEGLAEATPEDAVVVRATLTLPWVLGYLHSHKISAVGACFAPESKSSRMHPLSVAAAHVGEGGTGGTYTGVRVGGDALGDLLSSGRHWADASSQDAANLSSSCHVAASVTVRRPEPRSFGTLPPLTSAENPSGLSPSGLSTSLDGDAVTGVRGPPTVVEVFAALPIACRSSGHDNPSGGLTPRCRGGRVSVELPFEKRLLPLHAYPPDVSRGLDLPAGIASVVGVLSRHRASPPATGAKAGAETKAVGRWEYRPVPGAPAEAPLPRLLIMVAFPDASMPFNVIAVVCTIIAFFFGSIFNLLYHSDDDFVLLQRSNKLVRKCKARCETGANNTGAIGEGAAADSDMDGEEERRMAEEARDIRDAALAARAAAAVDVVGTTTTP